MKGDQGEVGVAVKSESKKGEMDAEMERKIDERVGSSRELVDGMVGVLSINGQGFDQ